MAKFQVGDVLQLSNGKPRYLVLKTNFMHKRAGLVYFLWDLRKNRRTGFQEEIIDRHFETVKGEP